MYKLWHFLFGWDYIHWENHYARGIARVFKLPDGRAAYWQYRNINALALLDSGDRVTWLTCTPDKYGL